MIVGVIVNPHARRNKKTPQRLEDAFTGRAGVEVRRLEDFADLGSILDDFIARDVVAVVISGGDGTVQAVQTHLAETLTPDRLPRLALLPDGTTNMNAADVGVHNPRSSIVLERLSVPEYCATSTDVRRRHTVRVDNPDHGGPLHGMFLGLGALPRAVRACHRDVHARGLAGDWATAATLAAALFQGATGRGSRDPDRIYQPSALTLTADGAAFADGDQLFVLVTTLHRLILGSRPFWNQREEALRVTVAAFPPRRLLRAVVPVMYGPPRRDLAAIGYRSTSARHLALQAGGEFVLDGELHPLPASGELSVSLGPAFDYLCS